VSIPPQANIPTPSDAFLLARNAQLQKELDYAQLKIQALEEQLRSLRIAKYGTRSETLSDLQLQLLDLEPGVTSEEVAAECARGPIPPPPSEEKPAGSGDKTQDKTRRNHPGRQKLPSHLERVEKIVACPAEECACGRCGQQTQVIGYEETEVLDVRPAEYYASVIKREKRACPRCEEQGVRTAGAPERIAPKSLLSDNVIIDLLVSKYCDSLPLYRQQAMLRRDGGVEIALSTLDDAVMRVGDLLKPITAAIKRDLLAGSYLQADETPVGVQTHDKRGSNHQAYMWQYGSPGKSVVFDFRMGRDGEGPKQFLGKFEGLLQTDAYQGYSKVGGPKMVHACCLAHARRKFVDAVKLNPVDADSARIVAGMDELFAMDRAAKENNMNHTQRDALRQELAPRLLEQLRADLLALQKKALPKSAAAQAANYTLSLWGKLTLFLQYPELELSTNSAENSMRPIAIGRKNWLHLGSKEAGPKIAAIFSVFESCRRLRVPIRKYLAAVLPGLANRSIRDLRNLTPSAYAAQETG
jgi:transposase